MAFVLVVKLALWLLGSCLELATQLLLPGLVFLLLRAVELVRLPGQAADAALQVTRDGIAAAGEFVLGLAWEAALAVVRAFVEFLWAAVASAAELAVSAAAGLVEAARENGEEAAKAAAELLERAADAVAGVVVKLGESYVDAFVHYFLPDFS